MASWNRFIRQFKKDVKQWLFFMALLSVMRFILIAVFSRKIDTLTPPGDILKAFVNGFRYDAMASTYIALIPLLLSVLGAFIDARKLPDTGRAISGKFFIVLSVILFIITIGYFREYNDQFNHWIFNLYYDDTRAIFSTIWSGYNLVPNVIAMVGGSYLVLRLHAFVMKSTWLDSAADSGSPPILLRIVYAFAAAVVVFVGLRGSYGHRPAKLEDAAITRDEFLNKAVLNPYSALTYAYRAHRKIFNLSTGIETFLPDGDVRNAAGKLFNNTGQSPILDDYLKRTAAGRKNGRPRHIFLVVMESYDAWPLLQKYASLGLTPELTRLAGAGIHISRFLPSSDGTAMSLSALITGLPDVNVVTNYQKTSQKAYPSSIAESFKRLGYRTRFFYGGYLSWQKLGDFVKAQGFEEIYGAAHIGPWASHNEWGVEDDVLFDFALNTVQPSAGQPSLNVILTTSYHPPYELNVYAKGFPLKKVPECLVEQFDGSVSLKTLGHLWYADRCAGNFIREAEARLDRTLFAVTGDHYGRKFINLYPDFFEESAVPFILYGKEALSGLSIPPRTAGSHIDIAPTLIEMTAPRGFTYYALGHNIFDAGGNRYGVGREKIISPDFLFDARLLKFHPLPGIPLPKKLPDPAQLKLMHDRMSGIAWWRIMRGERLPLPGFGKTKRETSPGK